jgi:hypothetical protein
MKPHPFLIGNEGDGALTINNGGVDTIDLPLLTGGLEWNGTNLQSTEPSTATRLVLGTALFGLRRRRQNPETRNHPQP